MKSYSMHTGRFVLGGLLALVLVFSPLAPAQAQTLQELQAQIQSLLATIATLQSQLQGLQGGGGTVAGKPNVPSNFAFTRTLTQGSSGTDVLYLQRVLNTFAASRIAATGVGSPGQETQFFGPLTRAAVVRFQESFASEVLTPLGLTRGTGVVGPATRAKLNGLIAAGFPTIPGTPPVVQPPVTGTSTLTAAPGSQPSASLAPENASRLPFTRITLTAGANAATINGITVEKTGLANDAVFSGIVLLDQDGMQIGTARTLNANHQATIGEQITIPAGTSRTFTVAGNMASSLDAYAGQIAGLSVVRVDTPSGTTVSGSFPIAGAQHTINATFQIGSATVRVGGFGTASATRELGTDNYSFSSFIVTAGSQEDVRLMSVRWNQSGSAASTDLADVVTIVDSTSYPTTVSSNGRFYTSTFGNGILIPRGQSREIIVRGDILTGSGRTIAFDIDRASDIFIVGNQYNYGIAPTAQSTSAASDATAEFTTGTPFFDASLVTVSGAALTVSRATSTPAQNIGVGVANQTLGGFTFDVQGESVTVQNMVFDIAVTRASGSSAAVEDIDSISLVNQSGTVVAGPVDATGTGTTGTATFTSSVTLPQGITTLMLRGQLGTDFRDGDTIIVSLEPASDITNATGGTSGNTITASPSATITGNTVTVRGTDVNVSIASTPVAQTLVAGAQNTPFVRLQFDATASGEDLRLSTFPVQFTHGGTPQNLTNCRAYNATSGTSTTPLTSGSNVVNPPSSFTSGNTLTFTLDSPLTIPRSQITTVEIRCDLSSSAAAGLTYSLGLSTAPTLTGVQSSQSVTGDVTASVGPTMTVAGAGGLTVTESPSSPSYGIAASGDTRTLAVLQFSSTNEAVDINQLGLQLTATASSSPADLTSVTLWDGSTQVGTAFFVGSNTFATSTLTSDFIVPQFGQKNLEVRGTFAQIGTGQAGTEGAFIKVDYDGNNASTTRGIGLSSGTTITSSTTSDTDTEGVRLFNTVPTVVRDTVPSTILVNGDQVLMRFRVTADDNDSLGIYKLSLSLATSSATVTGINIYAFTDSGYSSPVSGVGSGGQLDDTSKTANSSGIVEIYAENAGGVSNPIQVPAGGTRYFEVRGTIAGTGSGSVVTTTLEGDSAYPSLSTLMGTATAIDADANDDFIWSPNATTTSTAASQDWTNGYGVSGLPSAGLTQTVSR